MRPGFEKLLKQLRKKHTEAEIELVRKAYRFASEAHASQTRLSGEPYIIHTLTVAHILATLGLDLQTVAAGLLHDVLEDTQITAAQLTQEFGGEITSLVDGVTKISGLHFSEGPVTREVKQAHNVRKMLVATAQDVRVILIKLADRLHNIRTIDYLPESKRQRIAQETLDIYAPLAHRLGISTWKWELEDHAFHCLLPKEYKAIAERVAMKRREREAYLHNTISFLDQRLQESEVLAHVIGRPKHLFSIYQKMVQQGKDFDEIMDLEGVRIITQTVSGCYNALGVVHSLWTPVPGRFKDYIAMPKFNMYQAIHTTIMRESGKAMEIQIRTEEMDRTAREGIAAHWIYKEGAKGRDHKLDDQLKWLRQMYEWLQDSHAPEELMDSVRRDFTPQHVYVFTPKGEVKELPKGATPLDFAYIVHSELGHHCNGARVNNRMVPLRYNLQTGDVVEIQTSKSQVPHYDWLDLVVTGKARTRIRQRLRELGELPASELEPQKETTLRPRAKTTETRAFLTAPRIERTVLEGPPEELIRIEGTRGYAVQFAKCCSPRPGMPVLGYVTRKPAAITVHRADCNNFSKSERDPNRIVAAAWEGDPTIQAGIRVALGPRPNVLADVTNALRPMNVDISKATFGPGDDGTSYFDFVFQASDEAMIERIRRTLLSVSGVTAVDRFNAGDDLQKRLARVV